MNTLQEEFDFYVNQQKELVSKYRGKYLVIKGKEVIGAYDTELEAYSEGVKQFKQGEFLLQPCLPGEDNYSQTFYSRVGV